MRHPPRQGYLSRTDTPEINEPSTQQRQPPGQDYFSMTGTSYQLSLTGQARITRLFYLQMPNNYIRGARIVE